MRLFIDAQTGTWGDADDDFFIIDIYRFVGNETLIREIEASEPFSYEEREPINSDDELAVEELISAYLSEASDEDIAEFGRNYGSAVKDTQPCGRRVS